MSIDEKELRAACREVASNTLWQTKNPRDIHDIIDVEQIDRTINGYMSIALQLARDLDDMGVDPGVVSRAVRYLALEHAIPPMKDDLRWFDQSLEVLVRLVHPTAGASEAALAFMDDLEGGIERFRADLE